MVPTGKFQVFMGFLNIVTYESNIVDISISYLKLWYNIHGAECLFLLNVAILSKWSSISTLSSLHSMVSTTLMLLISEVGSNVTPISRMGCDPDNVWQIYMLYQTTSSNDRWKRLEYGRTTHPSII